MPMPVQEPAPSAWEYFQQSLEDGWNNAVDATSMIVSDSSLQSLQDGWTNAVEQASEAFDNARQSAGSFELQDQLPFNMSLEAMSSHFEARGPPLPPPREAPEYIDDD